MSFAVSELSVALGVRLCGCGCVPRGCVMPCRGAAGVVRPGVGREWGQLEWDWDWDGFVCSQYMSTSTGTVDHAADSLAHRYDHNP